MRNQKIYSFIIGLLLLTTFVLPQHAFAFEKLFYFFDNTYGFTNFKKHANDLDVIAPQVYTVGYDLEISKPSSTKLIRDAKNKDVATMPLIVNDDFSKILMSDILLSQDAQDKIIAFMIAEAKKQNYIGWQFDFENINHLDRDMYSAFVAKTYKKMKEANLQFSVAVIPRSKPYDVTSKDQDWSSGYDFKKIGENSDFISIMSYDDPYSLGPVASLPYTQKILSYMLTQVPGPKMSLGIPLYCWKWDADTGTRLGSLTQKLASAEYAKGSKKTKTKEYDEVLGATKYTYTKDGNNYATWCESEESLQSKFDLIDKYSLRGFSAWAIGQENTWFWSFLNDF